MLRQFIRLIINRNFNRNRFHTFLNIFGLAIGLMAFILISLYLQHKENYDKFHSNYHKIYRVLDADGDDLHGGSPAKLAPYLSARIPEIQDYVRIERKTDIMVYHQKERFYENKLIFSESDLFHVFDFNILKGERQDPLNAPNDLVITESVAEKYFGNRNPIGKSIKLTEKKQTFIIRAVAEDPPSNSTIQFRFIIPFKIIEERATWGQHNFTTYLMIDPAVKEQAINKIHQTVREEEGEDLMKFEFVKLQPLKDLRFEPVRGNEFSTLQRKYIRIYWFAALFILLLAAINYTNLASAISIRRSKEVALKKMAGSTRKRIAVEVLFESIVLSMIALLLALILVELLRPYFNQLISSSLAFDYSHLPYYLIITLIVGIISGLYPAIYTSRFDIMSLLKETMYKGRKAATFRNVLVLIQFGITSFLLICALTYNKQLNYLNNRNLGMQTKHIYNLKVHWADVEVEALKQEIKNSPAVTNVTTTSYAAGLVNWNQSAYWKGMREEEQINMYVHKVDKDFFETLEIGLMEGENQYKKLERKDKRLYLLNESAKKYTGWERATGKAFSVMGNPNRGEIVGVTEDFNYRSLYHHVDPAAFILSNSVVKENMLIKVKPGHASEVKDFVKQQWQVFAPDNAPFIYTSFDDDFEKLYRDERRTKKVIIAFTIVGLIISFLGLMGLATHISLQRTKEIGIRKVLGANEGEVVKLLISSFLKWVLIAFVIASPLAYIYLQRWLQNFANHIDLGIQVFIITGLFSLAIGFISVFIQTYRVATTNPVDSLRDE